MSHFSYPPRAAGRRFYGDAQDKPIHISRPSQEPITHSFRIALQDGDALVLATDKHDEYHNERESLYPLGLIYVDKITPEGWELTKAGHCRQYGTGMVQVHPVLKLGLSDPLQINIGRTVFQGEITHGYRLHFLNFVRNRLPEIYSQLDFDS